MKKGNLNAFFREKCLTKNNSDIPIRVRCPRLS